MKKLILSLCVALSLTACDNKKANETAQTKPTIKIGITLPLTGDAADVAQAAKQGLEMVLDELNQKELKYKYQLIFEDNQMNPQKVASSVNKLINMDKSKAIISIWNLMGNITSALAEQNDVMSFACSIGEEVTKGRYNFNTFSSNYRLAKALVENLKKKGIKTVALMTDNSGMRQQYDEIKDYMKKNSDIQVVFEEFFNPGEKDYKAAIIKAAQTKPDMYLYSGYNPSTYIFMKQLKEITGGNNVTTIDMFVGMPAKDRDIIEGLWYVDSNGDGTKEFQDKLLKEKGLISQSCTGNTVANLQIIVEAYENAPVKEGEITPNNEAVRQWIFDNIKDFDTYSGKLTVVREGLFDKQPSIKIMVNREPIEVKE